MDVQEVKSEFVALVQLPKPMRDTILDSLDRGESYSALIFMSGYNLANKKKEENNATGNECREFREGRSAI